MLDEQRSMSLKKRVDMLALSLALKPNDKNFDQNDDYKLLISTYIKMLEQDQDEFLLIEIRSKISFDHWSERRRTLILLKRTNYEQV